jgi:hypothetical protein
MAARSSRHSVLHQAHSLAPPPALLASLQLPDCRLAAPAHHHSRPPAMLPTKEQSCSLLMPPPTEMAPPTFEAVFSMKEQAVKLAEPPAGKGGHWVSG